MNSLKRYVNLLYQKNDSGQTIWVLTAAGIIQGMMIFDVEDPKKKKGVFSDGLFDAADPFSAEFMLTHVTLIPTGKAGAKGEVVQLSNTVISYDAALAWGDDYSFYYLGEEPNREDDDEDEKDAK